MSKSHVSIFKCHQKVVDSIPAASLSFPTVTGLSIVMRRLDIESFVSFPHVVTARNSCVAPRSARGKDMMRDIEPKFDMDQGVCVMRDGCAVRKEKSNQIAVKKIENSHIPEQAATFFHILVKAVTFSLKAARSGKERVKTVFTEMLLNIIHSNEFPLHTRVRATEQFTKFPTTTIHELAAPLTEDDLNPRISEAILMFLPHLDEPAAGIQLRLAPAILGRSLEHVLLASVPMFLEPPTAKPLKIGVFKELVRIITTYIKLPEMQDLVRQLWDRPLHQDVRIALLQSILLALDSPHQDLAWYIIDKATASLSTLQADDTLFVLLAVTPPVSSSVARFGGHGDGHYPEGPLRTLRRDRALAIDPNSPQHGSG
ncbi:hypothetical protein B0H10DRAFT_1970935 [Mycena sp. CBHHK59/15]|nr:hypothetical protein B0H10DRAFT_1970935 [Mycena sp. CBHHK59/15]